MNRQRSSPSPFETFGNVLAFLLILAIIAAGGYFVYSIALGDNSLLAMGGTTEVRPTEPVVVALPTLTPFNGSLAEAVSSATPMFQQPTAAPPTATPTLTPTKTPFPTSAPSPSASPSTTGVPTLFAPPTAEFPSPIPATLAPPTAVPPTAIPTVPPPTPIPAPPPPTAAPALGFTIAYNGTDFGRGCSGHYIFGYVRDGGGNPLPGLRVRVTNEYGLEIPPATTKTDPPGWYDVPISQDQATWYVQVVDAANTSLSPSATVFNSGNFVEGVEGCWHQVDFVRN